MAYNIEITERELIEANARRAWNALQRRKSINERIMWYNLPDAQKEQFTNYYKETVVDVNKTKKSWNQLQMQKAIRDRIMWDELSEERQNELVNQFRKTNI